MRGNFVLEQKRLPIITTMYEADLHSSSPVAHFRSGLVVHDSLDRLSKLLV